MSPLTVGVVMQGVRNAPVPFFVKPIINMIISGVESSYLRPNYKVHFDFLEAELSARPWLAGEEFSAADILLSFPLDASKGRGLFTEGSHPTLWAYTERYAQRDAFKRATEKVLFFLRSFLIGPF